MSAVASSRRRAPGCRGLAGLVSLWGLLVARVAGAQVVAQQRVLTWSPAGTEVGFELDAEQTGYTGRAGSAQSTAREWLRLPFSGTLFKPGVLSYAVAWRPQIGQQVVTGLPAAYAVRHQGLDLSVNVFDALPVGLAYSVTRSASSMVGGAGADGHFGTSASAGTLRLQMPAFPVTVRYGSRYTNDLWLGGPTLPETRRRERLRSLELQGQSSKTLLTVNRTVFDDRIGRLSFSSADGEVAHTRRWGRGSSLQSTVGAGERSGDTPHRRLTWSERVQVRHSAVASSELHAVLRRSTTSDVLTSGYIVGGATRFRPRPWLDADVSGSAQHGRQGAGRVELSSARPHVGYTASLPFGATLVTGAWLTLERERRSFGGDVWFQVVDERHATQAGAHGAALQFPDAEEASVSVRSADGTFAFVRGVDYELLVEAREMRLLLLPGGRIPAGALVLVSYRYRVVPGLDQRAATEAAEASLVLDGFTLRYSQSSRQVHALGAVTPAIGDGRDRAAAATLRRNSRRGSAELTLEHRDRRQEGSGYSIDQAQLALLPPGRERLQTAFGAAASRSRSGGRTSSALSARGTGSVTLAAWLRVQGSLEGWLWRYADARPDRILAGGAEVDWRFGRVDTQCRYSYQERSTVLTGRQHRLTLRVLRRF